MRPRTLTTTKLSLHHLPLYSSDSTLEINIDFTTQELLLSSYFLLGKLEGISENLIKDDAYFLEDIFLIKEAVESCKLEGSAITFIDFLKHKSEIVSYSKKEIEEVFNYLEVSNAFLKAASSQELSLELLKNINERLSNNKKANFVTLNNWQELCPNHQMKVRPDVKVLDNLGKILHEDTRIPLLIKIGIIYSELENLCLFEKNNGKTLRLLIYLFLSRKNILRKPVLYISKYFKASEEEYRNKLKQASAQSGIESWLKFFLSNIITTANSVIQTTQNINTLFKSDTQKIQAMGRTYEKGLQLLRYLYEKPFVSIKNVEKITSLTNPNAILLVSKFVNNGILEEITGQKRNRIFVHRDYIKLLE